MKRILLRLFTVGFFLPGLVWAQEDAPERGVARISLINGDVSVRRGDSGDWVAAAVNGPLVIEDSLLTGPGSRAEIQFDYANMLRLGSDTEVRISQLENGRYQVQVARGTTMLSVLRDSDAQMEVDTPNVAVRPVKLGMYRIGVGPDGQSEVTVREGEAEVFTPWVPSACIRAAPCWSGAQPPILCSRWRARPIRTTGTAGMRVGTAAWSAPRAIST